MKQITKILFAVSISAIFGIAAVSGISFQQAQAQIYEPPSRTNIDFTADLVNTGNGTSDAEGKAKFWLGPDGEYLKYKIVLKHLDIIGFGDTGDDVTGIHFHDADGHVLNVYKSPGQDDDDLVIKPTKGIIKGIWDLGDENTSYGMGMNSENFMLSETCASDISVNIHGEAGLILTGTINPTAHGTVSCNTLIP